MRHKFVPYSAGKPQHSTNSLSRRDPHVSAAYLAESSTRQLSAMQQPFLLLSPIYASAQRRERELFHMFRNVTVHRIAGVLDQAFWLQDVPRIAQVYPSIWGAALSLAAMHRMLTTRAQASADTDLEHLDDYRFTLKYYNTSIRHLIEITQLSDLDRAHQEMVLVTCVLLCCLGLLQADLRTALTHAWNYCKLVRQWQYPPPGASSSTTESLIAIYHLFHEQYVSAYAQTLAGQSFSAVRGPEPDFSAAMGADIIITASEPTELIESLPKPRLAAHHTPEACPLIVHLWSIDAEVELHLSFGDIAIPWSHFYLNLKSRVDFGHEILEESVRAGWSGKITFAASLTSSGAARVAICSRCGNIDHLQRPRATTFVRKQPRMLGLWDANTLAWMSAHHAHILEGDLLWCGSVAYMSHCQCVPASYVCPKHVKVAPSAKLLRLGGARMAMKVIAEASRDRLAQALTIIW